MADISTISNEIPSANAARLPALGAPELSVDYLAKIKEICEVLLGRRGSTWDRAVTFRDMQDGGLGGFIPGMVGGAAFFNPGTGQITTDGGATFDIDAALRESSAYKDLLTRIGSAEELESLPEQISLQLRDALDQVARERGADIRSLEGKLQNEQVSLAWRLDEVTASLHQAAAGVRQYSATFADDVRAVATRIEQVAADLAAGGGGVEVQEQLTAISDAVDGLKGQWSLKIQTNPTAGQPPVIAGIALSVEDPIAGPGTSSLVFLSEKVGFFTEGGTLNPFSISGNQVMMSDVIAKRLRVIMDDGTVVLDAGLPIQQQTRSSPNMVPRLSAWPVARRYGTPTPWLYNDPDQMRPANGEMLILDPGSGYIAWESDDLPLAPGEWYTISFSTTANAANAGVRVNVYGTNIDSQGAGGTLPMVTKRHVVTEQMPANASAPRLRIFRTTTTGQIGVWDIKISKGKVDTAWSEDIITNGNASVMVRISSLAALSGFFGNVEIGPGGALRQGMPDYATSAGFWMGMHNSIPKFSIGVQGGAMLTWDGTELDYGGKISNQMTLTITDNIASSKANNSGVVTTLGSLTVNIAGGNAPHSVTWAMNSVNSSPDSSAASAYISSADDAVSVSLSGKAPNNTQLFWRMVVTVRDARGITASISRICHTQFGTPV